MVPATGEEAGEGIRKLAVIGAADPAPVGVGGAIGTVVRPPATNRLPGSAPTAPGWSFLMRLKVNG